jgi:hypothetical protein
MGDLRGTVIENIITRLKDVMSINLVKPYEGEIDRYRKIGQIENEIFPAEVNMATPFALVISKDRENKSGSQNRAMKLQHNISVYIGVSNTHSLSNEDVPDIYTVLNDCVLAIKGENGLVLVNDGIYLCKTDLFIVYDQQWYRQEVAY